MNERAAIVRVAKLVGIEPHFTDALGQWHKVADVKISALNLNRKVAERKTKSARDRLLCTLQVGGHRFDPGHFHQTLGRI